MAETGTRRVIEVVVSCSTQYDRLTIRCAFGLASSSLPVSSQGRVRCEVELAPASLPVSTQSM